MINANIIFYDIHAKIIMVSLLMFATYFDIYHNSNMDWYMDKGIDSRQKKKVTNQF